MQTKRSRIKTEAEMEATAPVQETAARPHNPSDKRADLLRELLRICGMLIADSVDWDDVERRSEELFRGASIAEQQSLLAALDAAIGRVRSGLIKAGGIYRFREIVNE